MNSLSIPGLKTDCAGKQRRDGGQSRMHLQLLKLLFDGGNMKGKFSLLFVIAILVVVLPFAGCKRRKGPTPPPSAPAAASNAANSKGSTKHTSS